MRNSLLIFLMFGVIVLSCQKGKHKDANSQAMQKEMKSREFVKLTQGEIHLEANRVGLIILDASDNKRDSLVQLYQAQLGTLLVQDSTSGNTSDRQLLEAYAYQLEQYDILQDNLQKSENFWIYTHPLLNDSTGELKGILNIKIPQKELILNFKGTK